MTGLKVNQFINDRKRRIAYPPPLPPSPASLCVWPALPSASVPLSWPPPRTHECYIRFSNLNCCPNRQQYVLQTQTSTSSMILFEHVLVVKRTESLCVFFYVHFFLFFLAFTRSRKKKI